MRLLLLKLGLFVTICFVIVTIILINFGGNIDFFYQKFTTPKAKSMIIGDSRSFQGIQPSIINDYFKGRVFDLPMFNYSFTIAQAIIGPLYNESILKKLDDSSTNGIFIISITPEMLSEHSGYNNTNGEFREQGQPPHNMEFVNVNPNYEYFFKNLSFFHFKAIFKQNATTHKDGWLEENNLPKDARVFEKWKKTQIDFFLKDVSISKISKVRIESLKTLIEQLKQHGDVYLVRMPISSEFHKLEQKHYPNFNKIIDSITKITNVDYFNFNKLNKHYKTYDGHHINKYKGKEFTFDLCTLIDNSLKKKNN